MTLLFKLFRLFFVFFKIGLFTFGGGHAMIPLITEEMTAEGWMAEDQLSQLIAVSESTPGPFAINIATFIGSTVSSAEFGTEYGILGSLFATLGVITPSILIILLIASLFQTFSSNKYVRKIIKGINPVIIGLIFTTGLWFLFNQNIFPKENNQGPLDIKLFDYVQIILFVFLYWFSKIRFVKRFVDEKNTKVEKKIHPIFLIIIAGVCGMIIYQFYTPINIG